MAAFGSPSSLSSRIDGRSSGGLVNGDGGDEGGWRCFRPPSNDATYTPSAWSLSRMDNLLICGVSVGG